MMADTIQHPCAVSIDQDCFKADPEFAKRAFSYRLLQMFSPTFLSRRLLKLLKMLNLDPGISIPPGIDLPPGTVVYPGTVFPPDWHFGDPLPPGVILPYSIDNPSYPGYSPPSSFISPWSPGPAHRPLSAPAGPAGSWVVHSDDTNWQDYATYVHRAYWDAAGEFWYGDIVGFELEAIGGWNTGYKPTKIRMELGGVSSCYLYLIYAEFNIVADLAYTNLKEVDIDYGAYPGFDKLLIVTTDATAKNISFFEPA